VTRLFAWHGARDGDAAVTPPLNHSCVDEDEADTAGVLVLRVWIEPNDPDRTLRIRVTTRADVTDPLRTSSRTTASVDDAVGTIRSWLDGFVAI
jgi:hypothetical protein